MGGNPLTFQGTGGAYIIDINLSGGASILKKMSGLGSISVIRGMKFAALPQIRCANCSKYYAHAPRGIKMRFFFNKGDSHLRH